MTRYLLLSLLFLFAAAGLRAQRCVQVFDRQHGKPLTGASVSMKMHKDGQLIGGATDTAGKFCFSRSGGADVEVSYQDYNTLKLFVNDTAAHIYAYLEMPDIRTNPVVVTAELAPTSSGRSSNNIRVIDRQKIEKMAAQNLNELLNNEVNISLGQDNVLGSSVIMQGISGQNIKILVNQVPVIGRLNGNIDVSQINLNNVERVEIIEGPMSAVYGSDALGGVINIITKKPLSRGWDAMANSYTDALQNWNFDAATNKTLKNNISLNLSGGRYFFTGRDFTPETRSLEWKPKEKIFGETQLGFKTWKVSHNMRINSFHEKLTDRSDAEYTPYSITGYNSYYKTNRTDYALSSRLRLNKWKSIDWINSFNTYNRFKTTIKRNLVTGEETPYRADAQDTTRFSLFVSRFTFSTSKPRSVFNYQLGYDVNLENGSGKRLLQNGKGIDDIAVFAVAEIKPYEFIKIRPSVRLIHNSRYGNPLAGSGIFSHVKAAPVIPSLQLKFDITDRLVLRGNVSRGFRAPSLKELNFFFVDVNHNVQGNPDLKAETSENYNLSLDYRVKTEQGNSVSVNYSMFHNHISNKINLALMDAATNRYTYINVGQFRSQGINLNADYYHRYFSVNAGVSAIGILDYLKNDTSVDNYSYYFQGRMNFSLSWPEKNVQLNLLNKYHGVTRGYNADYSRYTTSDYLMSDLTLQKGFYDSKVNLTAGLKNVFGVTFVQSSRKASTVHDQSGGDVSISPGRTFFVKLSIIVNDTWKKAHKNP